MSATIDRPAVSVRTAGFLLGFAFAGFFDGILLHQILQWHHLIDGVEPAPALRDQLLADGLFHLLMYLLMAVGVVLLWCARRYDGGVGGAALLRSFVIGFAVWHLIDAVLVHWVLGLHRIRTDAVNPLLWDLLWLGAFGVLPCCWQQGSSGCETGR